MRFRAFNQTLRPVQLGTNQTEMRAINEKLVLSLLRKLGPLAKVEIAKLTGLTAQTVSVIMRSLEEDKLLLKEKPKRGKVGQPSVPLYLNPKGAFFFGLKIGRRTSELVLIDFIGNICSQLTLTYDYPIATNIIQFTQDGVSQILEKFEKKYHSRIAGFGVASPFDLWNWAKIIGVSDDKMEHWKNFDIKKELSEFIAYPIYIQNDASAACGAELIFGNQKQSGNFLYFYIGYFAGGGIVLNNQLFDGPNKNAGALGSMPVQNRQGEIVQLIELSSLVCLEKKLIKDGLDSSSIWLNVDEWLIPESYLEQWIDESSFGLTQAIISSCSVIDFETVIIDGSFSQSICQKIVNQVQKNILSLQTSGIQVPTISTGTLGLGARSLGAACIALSNQFMIDA